MADQSTREGAALELLRLIAFAEGKNVTIGGGNARAPSRAWILWTYAQCLQTVSEPQAVKMIAEWPIPKDQTG